MAACSYLFVSKNGSESCAKNIFKKFQKFLRAKNGVFCAKSEVGQRREKYTLEKSPKMAKKRTRIFEKAL